MEKKIASEKVVLLYGMRAIIGTFDKHNPTSIYIDGTINIEGECEREQLKCAKEMLEDALVEWVRSQSDYDRKRYVKIVEYPETSNKQKYTSKTSKLRFDLTLKPIEKQKWSQIVELTKGHLMNIYKQVVSVILSCGLELKDFKGYNFKTGEFALKSC